MQAQADRLFGLAPIVDARTKVLILGSFPGAASLQAAQYYAHPRNQFWPITAALWPDAPQPADYLGRCAWLREHQMGLWDIYASCERQGSLDTAIRNPELNDFAALKAGCPQLQLIGHNGGESYRHTALLQRLGFHTVRLPSSSPANARSSLEQKVAAWRQTLQSALQLPPSAGPQA